MSDNSNKIPQFTEMRKKGNRGPKNRRQTGHLQITKKVSSKLYHIEN